MKQLHTAEQLQEAMRRQDKLTQLDQVMAPVGGAAGGLGLSLNQAARLVGESAATLSRWRAAFAAGGFDGLIPRWNKCGRKPLAVPQADELEEAKRLYVQTGSKTTALRMLAHSDVCTEQTRAAILKPRRSKHTITKTLRAAIEVPEAVKSYYKSPRQTALNYFFNPRDLTYTDSTGARRELRPGDLFERDDMTVNFGWWVPWEWGGDKCSDKYGVRLLRGQLLPLLDAASLRFVAFALIARFQDSYRADDIWQFIGRTYRDVGLPRLGERLERGIWEGTRINGLPVEPGHTSTERRLGGLAALGVRVFRSYTPLTKIIENRFSFSQTWMATIHGQLGRTRGEMERQTKLWTACREGRADPREYFLSIDQVTERIEAQYHAINGEPVEGEIYRGVPERTWAEAIGADPLRPLAADQSWLFARDRRVVTVLKGMARVRLTGPRGPFSYWFHHEDLYKHEGRKVAVYFDSLVEGGEAVVTDAAGENPNEILCVAREAGRVPQFAMAEGFDDTTGFERRRAFANAVRSEYRALGIAGVRLARASAAEDGRGGVAEVEVMRGGTRPLALPTSDPAAAAGSRAGSGAAVSTRSGLTGSRAGPSPDDLPRRLQEAEEYEGRLRAAGKVT